LLGPGPRLITKKLLDRGLTKVEKHWSKAWVCGRSLAGIAGSHQAELSISVSCECFVLSGRGFCVVLIARTEEYYRMWCV